MYEKKSNENADQGTDKIGDSRKLLAEYTKNNYNNLEDMWTDMKECKFVWDAIDDQE